MNRHLLVALEMAIAALLPDAAMAQRHPPCMTTGIARPIPPAIIQACEDLKNQLVVTWALVTYERVFQDGRKEPLLGAAPRGTLMLDKAGNFTQILARSDLQPFNDKMSLEDTHALIEAQKLRSVTSGLARVSRRYGWKPSSRPSIAATSRLWGGSPY